MNSPRQNLRVLVADGSSVVRKRLCHLVEETGGLTLAGDAEMAVEAFMLFVSRRPDAVIINVQMPDASGLQVLRRIKEAAPECLVIMICDESIEDYRAVCDRFRADYLFHKSTEFEAVLTVLSQAAENRETAGPNQPRWLRRVPQDNEPLCTAVERKP